MLDLKSDAQRLYHSLTNVINAAADREIAPEDAMSGVAATVANMALQMDPFIRLTFFDLIRQYGVEMQGRNSTPGSAIRPVHDPRISPS